MKKVKIDEDEKVEIKSKVKSFNKFKKARMVFIAGNFMKGGFSLSQNKMKAILENLDILREFANGIYDKNIDELNEDEKCLIKGV